MKFISKKQNVLIQSKNEKSSALPRILLLKEVGSARLRESDLNLISPKTPAPQYQPIDRKKRK